jgi:hypothetical protein
VPAQQRLGLDQERSPASPREHPGQRGQDDPVCGPVAGPALDLAPEDLQLVAQDQDLHLVLHGRAGGGRDEQLQDATEDQVDDRVQHGR